MRENKMCKKDLNIGDLNFLRSAGVLTEAGLIRGKIIIEFNEMDHTGKYLKKQIYKELAERFFLSEATVRDVVLGFKKSVKRL